MVVRGENAVMRSLGIPRLTEFGLVAHLFLSAPACPSAEEFTIIFKRTGLAAFQSIKQKIYGI